MVAYRIGNVMEPRFHPDSYGYRPGRGALDAVGRCRERCWSHDWVVDLDVRAFFDSVPWDKVLSALEANVSLPWVLLYVRRWLAVPVMMADGSLVRRDRGTSQGGLCSAEHKPPYEQCRVMRSAGLLALVRASWGRALRITLRV